MLLEVVNALQKVSEHFAANNTESLNAINVSIGVRESCEE